MLPVALGVAASGVSAYAFLALTARYFGPLRYAPLATFWSFTFLVGPGCFSSVEKEAGRLISGGLAGGDQRAPVLRHAALLGALVAVTLTVCFAAGSPVIVDRLFAGNWALLVAFLVSLGTLYLQYLSFGLLAGNSRFRAYGFLAGSEGVLRLVGALALLAVGERAVGPFAAVVALAPALGVVSVLPSLRGSSGLGVDIGHKAMARSMSWLLVGSLFTSILVGSGPITVQLLGGDQHRVLTARFLSALVLVRVPLFLYSSAAATLLPALAGHVAVGALTAFRRTLNHLVATVALLGGVCVVIAAVAGPDLLRLVFGSGYELPGRDLAILASATAALLVATTLSVGLTAVGLAHRAAIAWAFGVATMMVVTALIPSLLLRVELGLLAGSAASAVAMLPPLYGRSALMRVAAGLISTVDLSPGSP